MKASYLGRIGVLALALSAASCGSVVRDGTGTSFLIVRELDFAKGNDPDEFVSNLLSDVVTKGSVFNDLARVTFQLGLKDPGPAGNPNTPTQNQAITVNRYHVRYFRADGRNTPGVDVPYPFDGAFTVTVPPSGTVEAVFNIVRHTAKLEAPLATLSGNLVILTTIAEITFYGQDQTGHEVMATARTSIDFANFGDPE
jgi:hypothetical protein